jgi:hypothetical protein
MHLLLILFFLLALPGAAQDFTQRGFIETQLTIYPQTAPNDSGHAVGESLFRYEASKLLVPGLRLNGAFDARTDTHRQDERDFRLDFGDRSIRRPALSVRRLSLTYNKGKLTAEIGKQFIRWGKADILNPTDRFAPRDFLTVVDNDFLPVTAARVTYASASNSIDLVWQPFFTPSRTPLFNQRWTVLPDQAAGLSITDAGARYPGGSQYGARFNHLGRGYEASLSFFEGHNHLPLLDAEFAPSRLSAPHRLDVTRFYPQLRLYGADAAVPLPWFTIKGEAAYFTSTTKQADEYVLYVIQVERQTGELSLVGGYAGEAVTDRRSPFEFSPERGLTKAFLGRASYTIDVNRSVTLETAVRQNAQGAYARLEYSQTFGQHWRGTVGFAVIQGDPMDFLGQYRRNSHGILALRYSF